MKALKFLAAAFVALAAIACGPENTDDPGKKDPEKGLEVTVSTYVIAADGEDAAQFTATYNNTPLTAEQLSITINNEPATLPGMKFTTTEAGTYDIEIAYKEEEHAKLFTIEALNPNGMDLSDIEESGMTLRATTTLFQINVDEVLLIVRRNGKVLEADNVMFFDYDTNEELFFESVEVVDINGTTHKLAKYTATEAGSRTIYATRSNGPGDTREAPITLTAVDFAIPSRALDPQPANTSFKKRSFITQFTGTECGYCPFFIAALHTLSEDETYNDNYVLAAVHTYSSNDPMYPYDFSDIDQSFGVSGYPTVIIDMNSSLGNQGYQTNLNQLKFRIDKSLEEPAKAGISAKISYDGGNYLVARATVKAAVDGNYRIGAWLVEDDIHAMQYNNGCKVEGVDFSTHEAAVRIADSHPEGSGNYAGHPLGLIKAGDMADYVFVMELKQDEANSDNAKLHWVSENCRLVFFVTVESPNGVYVTNVVTNDNLAQTITFDYE